MSKMNNRLLDLLAISLATLSVISERYLLPVLTLSAALLEELVKGLDSSEALPMEELSSVNRERELVTVDQNVHKELKALSQNENEASQEEIHPKTSAKDRLKSIQEST